MRPRVVLLILTWNRRDDVLRCADSLPRLAYPEVTPVVIDNASQDDTVAALHARHPELTVLQNAANLGYAGGNNVGIRWALEHGADYVQLINSDTEVTATLTAELVRVAESDARSLRILELALGKAGIAAQGTADAAEARRLLPASSLLVCDAALDGIALCKEAKAARLPVVMLAADKSLHARAQRPAPTSSCTSPCCSRSWCSGCTSCSTAARSRTRPASPEPSATWGCSTSSTRWPAGARAPSSAASATTRRRASG